MAKQSKKKTTRRPKTAAAESTARKASKTRASKAKVSKARAAKPAAKAKARPAKPAKKTAKKTTKKKTTTAAKTTAAKARPRPAAKKATTKSTRTSKAASTRAARPALTPSRPVASTTPAVAAKMAKTAPAVVGRTSTREADKSSATPTEDLTLNRPHGELSEAELRKVKTGLTKKDLDHFRDILIEKRAEIVGDVEGLEHHRTGGGEMSHMPLHPADVGSEHYEQEFNLGLMQSEKRLLKEIDDALGRIQNGTYGVCFESGQPIPRARLEIKPWAKYTIEVAMEREKRGLP